MKHVIQCMISLLCLGTAPARAADWAATFEAQAVGTYLTGDRPTVLVAGAGQGADPAPAAAALRQALRAGGLAALVMDEAALGAVRALDDQAIVKRAAGLPARVIVIVRVFPGEPDETAVVTFYSRQGKSLAALSATRGQVAPPLQLESGQGVSREAASAVDAVLKRDGDDEAPSDTERQYRRRHVGFLKLAVLRIHSSASATLSGHWGAPYRGDSSALLDPPDFFRAVGRPDHADFYLRRTRTKRWLSIPGWVLALGGAAMVTAGALHAIPEHCRAQDRDYECLDADATPNHLLLGFGAGLVAVGLAGIIAGAAVSRFPTTIAENHRLAATHNRRLRQQLGLPAKVDDDVPEDAQRLAAGPRQPTLQVLSTVTTHGGGLALRLDY